MSKEMAGFRGEVFPARCDCHRGQFVAQASLVDPIEGPIYLAHTFFKTEDEASKGLNGFVKQVAFKFLEECGINADSINQVEEMNGADADKALQRFMAQNNPKLH